MSEIKHNPELMAAVEHLYNQKIIKKDKDIVEGTGYSKGTVSGYIKGTAKASEEFLNKFEDTFKISLADFRNGEAPEPRKVILTGAHVTLQDHIDLLKGYNEKLFALLSSSLGNLQEGQRTMIAYQKAWVDHTSELESAGDPNKKEDLKYKFGKLVDDILSADSLSGNRAESGTQSKG